MSSISAGRMVRVSTNESLRTHMGAEGGFAVTSIHVAALVDSSMTALVVVVSSSLGKASGGAAAASGGAAWPSVGPAQSVRSLIICGYSNCPVVAFIGE
ncbi:hypothetical protein FKM82_003535 [Ascaphus truei]